LQLLFPSPRSINACFTLNGTASSAGTAVAPWVCMYLTSVIEGRSVSLISRALTSLLLCSLLLLPRVATYGFETDQYNLPPKPLADIGDEVSQHVEQRLRKVVEKINAEIRAREGCLVKNVRRSNESVCQSPEEEQTRLEYLRSNDAVANEAYHQLGAGVPPFTSMGTWMDLHHFRGQPARYRTSYWKSLFLFLPNICFTISPTVKLYGSEFGTDKIAHLFQQGYSYYKIYNRALAEGAATPEEATNRAVRWGQKTERTIYGTLVAGVYSNGDLAANYVGMKFYQGLTREIKIGDTTRPAILLLKDGVWSFNESVNQQELLLKPFVSDHLNEALNPSIFTKYLGVRAYVRRTVRRRSCEKWFDQYPNLSHDSLEEASRVLRLWHGEDYGFTNSEHFVTIANTCFEDNRAAEDE
jgi:hypothetical protein